MTTSRQPPRVFVSYSHDSPEHDERVLALVHRLRREGVDAWLDRFESHPAQGWPRWMQGQIERADFVLLVCTPAYRLGFEGEGGNQRDRTLSWQGQLLVQMLCDNHARNERIIPILLDSDGQDDPGQSVPDTGDGDHDSVIPQAFRPYTFHRLPGGYDDLYRRLTGQPEVIPGPSGPRRRLPQRELPVIETRSPGIPTTPAGTLTGRRLALVVIAPMVPALVWLVGVHTQRVRLELIGLSGTELMYPMSDQLVTGVAALLRLFWFSLIGPFNGLGVERWIGPLAVALVAVAVILRHYRAPGLAQVWLAGLIPVFGYGAILLAGAVGVHHVALPGDIAEWPCRLGPSVPEQIRFEVCPWLGNDSLVNDSRRIALAGLWGWLVVALGVALGLSLSSLERRWHPRAVIALGHAAVLLLALVHTPHAHAVGHWGLRYPRVTRIDPRCDPDLARAVATPDIGCRVLDVSAGSDDETVILQGYECPGDSTGSLRSLRLVRAAEMTPHQRCIQHTQGTENILNQG